MINLHNAYMSMSFRQVVKADGSIGRIGVREDGPACFEPEVYPHLITAAPALYQMLAKIKEALTKANADAGVIDGIELVMVFAQGGYAAISDKNINQIIQALKP